MIELDIALKIADFEIEINKLSSEIRLKPTESFLKGQKYYQKIQNGQVEKQYPNNLWEYRSKFKTDEWSQTLIDNFIDEIIIPRKDTLMEFAKSAYLELFVGIKYYNEANPGFHFNSQRLKALGDIGLELDIDMYCGW